MIGSFTEEDISKMHEFSSFLNQRAKFDNMSITDSVKLISHLQFFNNLAKKVEDNILELKKVHTKPVEQEVKPKSKSVKS